MKIFSMFDGVGGFIVGLNNANPNFYTTIYSNQYEPSRKSQDAYEVGKYRFPNIEHIPDDVAQIPNSKFYEMKKNGVNMIVGGFPCQDYSVARSKKNELGIEGKKGTLFWEIIRATRIINPDYLILENVDRLLKSPSTQRGRDFGIMLASFNELGYSIEWRVINAADYSGAQRRRRVFFFIFNNDTPWGKYLNQTYANHIITNDASKLNKEIDYSQYIFKDGLFAREFPIKQVPVKKRVKFAYLHGDIKDISDNFSNKFWNTGIMRYGYYYSIDTEASGEEKPRTLRDIIQDEDEISEHLYINDAKKLDKFKYLRGSKKIERKAQNGHKYIFSEGAMSSHDSLDLPARTMLTSEGSINRSTHLLFINGKYRLLSPIEAERLQDFPDDWTKYKLNNNGKIEEVSNTMRMFFMGNALVTSLVTRIGTQLEKIIKEYR